MKTLDSDFDITVSALFPGKSRRRKTAALAPARAMRGQMFHLICTAPRIGWPRRRPRAPAHVRAYVAPTDQARRGVITARIRLLSRITPAIMLLSAGSTTPALSASAMRARISSSVRAPRIAVVDRALGGRSGRSQAADQRSTKLRQISHRWRDAGRSCQLICRIAR
jgi:hypothetical protein